MYFGTYSCSDRTVALVLRCRNGSSKISSFGITPGVKPGSAQATSTTPSRTCVSNCSALPPSCMDGKTWTLMRPLESFSTFSAHGITKCFIGLATGGRNECTRSVTSCDTAAAGVSAHAAIATTPHNDNVVDFMWPSLKVGISPNAHLRNKSGGLQQSAGPRAGLGQARQGP